mgnify:CR=1 FL=1
MKVIEFRKILKNETYDNYYNDNHAWSRIYEYPLIISKIKKYLKEDSVIHNSSWGFEGIHVLFKEKLDQLSKNVYHSDIIESKLKNTFVYDITKEPINDEIEKYDIVLNVSTLEEVNYDHIKIFNNLFKQVKNGGIFIATFDLNSQNNFFSNLFAKRQKVLQLNKFEKLFSRKIKNGTDILNGENSLIKNQKYRNTNCGIMVLRK